MFETLVDAIEKSVACEDVKYVCLIKSKEKEVYVSYKDLYSKALIVLNNLQQKGVQPGNEVLIQVDNIETFLYTFWACILGMIVPVPISEVKDNECETDITKIWNIFKRPYLITDRERVEEFENLSVNEESQTLIEDLKSHIIHVNNLNMKLTPGRVIRPRADTPAFMLLTETSEYGTEGVLLTHGNILSNIRAMVKRAGIEKDDVFFSWIPVTYGMGLMFFHLLPLIEGVSHYIMPISLFFERPTLWMSKISERKITVTSSTDFGFKYFMSSYRSEAFQDWNLSCLKMIINESDSVSTSSFKLFAENMLKYGLKDNVLHPVFYMPEASGGICFPSQGDGLHPCKLDRRYLGVGDIVRYIDDNSGEGVIFVDSGYPLDDCFLAVFASDGKFLNENIVGHIWVKGKNVFRGCSYNKQIPNEVLSQAGWFDTGRLGFFANGRLVIVGKVKDAIFVNGESYYPSDIEETVEGVEKVGLGEVVVCGLHNDEKADHEVIAFVVNNKSNEDFARVALDIKDLVHKKIGISIRHFIPVDSVQKTATGRINRNKMIKMYKSGDFDKSVSRTEELMTQAENLNADEFSDNAEQKLLSICRCFEQFEEVGIEDNLFKESEISSEMLFQLYSRIEEVYPGRITIPEILANYSISKLAALIERRKDISVPKLKFPEDFFWKDSCKFETSKIGFKLDGELYKRINVLKNGEKVAVEDILLGIFSYLYNRNCGNSAMKISVLTERENTIANVSLCTHGYADLNSVFTSISKSRKNHLNTYCVNELKPDYLETEANTIRMLFYNANLLNGNINLLEMFDMAFGYWEENGITCSIEYNSGLLKREKISKLYKDYIKLVKLVSDKYGKAYGNV